MVNPLEIVSKIKSIIEPKVKAKELEFEVEVKGELPETMCCDLRRLTQVLFNLVFNALKYTFKGKITVKFWADEEFCAEVKDTGIGISSDKLDKINKLFGLLNEKVEHNETGIGLGLFLSKAIIKHMEGTLKISSQLDIGTSCIVKIPLNSSATKVSSSERLLDAKTTSGSKDRPSTDRVCPSRTPKVLVIDDDPFASLALCSMLKKLGCDVDKAANGQIGVETVSSRAKQNLFYDLVFMDANMPVLNGYEATKMIRRNKDVGTPIICVSAQESAHHKELCAESGMNDILTKPCTEAKLRQILCKYSLSHT